MKSILFSLIPTALFFLSSLSSFGRSPAVEPIMEISTERYKDVDPQKDPGFDFRQYPPVKVQWIHGKSSQSFQKEKKAMGTERFPATSHSSSTLSLSKIIPIAVVLISFPLALWFTLMRTFPAPQTRPLERGTQPTPTDESLNTISLKEARLKREEENKEEDTQSDDDDHFHRAS